MAKRVYQSVHALERMVGKQKQHIAPGTKFVAEEEEGDLFVENGAAFVTADKLPEESRRGSDEKKPKRIGKSEKTGKSDDGDDSEEDKEPGAGDNSDLI